MAKGRGDQLVASFQSYLEPKARIGMATQQPSQVSRPDAINPNLRKRKAVVRPLPDAEALVKRLREGDRIALAQAITFVESTGPAHQELARKLIELALPHTGNSMRVGITGSPGVGKSTFIEAFGLNSIESGYRPAVLAIDPSSQRSGGSILGDKTRMDDLSVREEAFIRPSPAGDSLGGVAMRTREVMLLCEAAGYDLIIIETVGVGQSEIAVHRLTDIFLLLLLPGAGDELQGIKRGIVEMADLAIVNKADGDRAEAARQTRIAYRNALHFLPPKKSSWTPAVVTCSALQHKGIKEVLQKVEAFKEIVLENGYLVDRRAEQAQFWLEDTLERKLLRRFFSDEKIKTHFTELKKQVRNGQISPMTAADDLWKIFTEK